MKVIVTGGKGFIGSCLIWKLNSQGIDNIVVVDGRGAEGTSNLQGKKFKDYIEKEGFLRLVAAGKLKKADLILHMGACTSTTELDASYLIENNYLYSKTLACWAFKTGASFLYASSAATYGDGEEGYRDDDRSTLKLKPLNMYGYSKHAFDLWLLKNRLLHKATGFKFFNVFGPNEYHKGEMKSVIAKVFPKIVRGEPIKLFKSYKKTYAHGAQERDFIYVKDAVEIVDYFIQHPGKRGIYNVGTGKARTWNDVAAALFSAIGKKARIQYIDMPQALRPRYQYFTRADMSKVKKAGCTYRCRSLEDAVKDYAGYLKNHAYL